MLHHDHSISHVAQPEERLKQPPIVSLMQANRGLIQDIKHADQAGPDLRRQADPLAFSSGQGRGRPIQREVIQPHVDEESQPLADLFQYALGNEALPLVQL